MSGHACFAGFRLRFLVVPDARPRPIADLILGCPLVTIRPLIVWSLALSIARNVSNALAVP